MPSMHTSPVMAHSLTRGDIIKDREGVFVRITAQPVQHNGGTATLTVTPVMPGSPGYGETQLIFFNANAPVDRVVGGRSAGL
jgi:hypothetical protein